MNWLWLYHRALWVYTSTSHLSITHAEVAAIADVLPGVVALLARLFLPTSIALLFALELDLRLHAPTVYSLQTTGAALADEFDPRLAPALWLYALRTAPNTTQPLLPFAWDAWVDVEARMAPAVVATGHQHPSCKALARALDLGLVPSFCTDLPPRLGPHTRQRPSAHFTAPPPDALPLRARQYVAGSYLKHAAPLPRRIVFIGASLPGLAIVVPVLPQAPAHPQPPGLVLSQMAAHYLKQEALRGRLVFDVLREGIECSAESTARANSLATSSLALVQSPYDWTAHSPALSPLDFVLDVPALRALLGETLDLRQLAASIDFALHTAPNYPKYFHEGVTSDTRDTGHHMDWRFYRNAGPSPYEQQAVLHRTTRAWLRFARAAGLQTWLAHGTLLGWYWNGMLLPWDGDVDVQVSMLLLVQLAWHYNQLVVADVSVDGPLVGPPAGTGTYFVDVGPSFIDRTSGNGRNAIDARFIDTATGMYVDITAIAHSDASMAINELLLRAREELYTVVDAGWRAKQKSAADFAQHGPTWSGGVHGRESVTEWEQQLHRERERLHRQRVLYNCRNNHFYRYEELVDLVPTLFEGTLAHVPHRHAQLLAREYRLGLHKRLHAQHEWKPALRLWVPNKVCASSNNGDACVDSKRGDKTLPTRHERAVTRRYTDRHALQKTQLKRSGGNRAELPEFPTWRIDPWMVHRLQRLRQMAQD